MEFTRFERARIIGARALQISMGAPVLVEITNDLPDPLAISQREFAMGVLPLTVKRETRDPAKSMRVR